MSRRLTLGECQPLVYPAAAEIGVELAEAASVELLNSPNFVVYLQKLHLNALHDLGKIPVKDATNSELVVKYTRIKTRIDMLEELIKLPSNLAILNEGNQQ